MQTARNSYLANRLREVLLSGKWIANSNYKEQLLNISWHQSIQKVQDLNTIASLTFHINYYLEGILYGFQFGKLDIKDKYSFDIPEIKNENDWHMLLNRFLNNATLFADTVEKLEDSILDQHFIDEKYGTYLRNIEAVIEHSYYHLGQVVLLKKLLFNRSNNL